MTPNNYNLDVDWEEVSRRLQEKQYERHPILKLRDNHIYLVKFLSEPRQVKTIYGEANVVNIELIKSNDHTVQPGTYSIFISQVVLWREIKRYLPITGKTLVVANLGKPEGKKYKIYRVMTAEEAGIPPT